MRKLEHPNCHIVYGAKCSLPDGGPLILTEVSHSILYYTLYYNTVSSYTVIFYKIIYAIL
jgi:hypothetical protein